MEPRKEEQKDQQPRIGAKKEKSRRFQLIKLEERIAPSEGPQISHQKHFCY